MLFYHKWLNFYVVSQENVKLLLSVLKVKYNLILKSCKCVKKGRINLSIQKKEGKLNGNNIRITYACLYKNTLFRAIVKMVANFDKTLLFARVILFIKVNRAMTSSNVKM
jgi:hypothetical protein